MYDGLNPVSITPENIGINEEDNLFIDKKNYRKKIRNLQKSIRLIDNSVDYNEIQNKDLYRSLIAYPNNENHNHSFSHFIHDFNNNVVYNTSSHQENTYKD
jgi:hypothetical protein